MSNVVIYIGGEAADMGAGTETVTLERYNTLLSKEQESYSFPFTIPATPRNRRLMGFPERFERVAKLNRRVAATLMSGAFVKQGYLYINDIAATSYDCNFTFDTANLYNGKGAVKLAQFGWEGMNTYDGNVSGLRDYFLSLMKGTATSDKIVVAEVKIDTKTYKDWEMQPQDAAMDPLPTDTPTTGDNGQTIPGGCTWKIQLPTRPGGRPQYWQYGRLVTGSNSVGHWITYVTRAITYNGGQTFENASTDKLVEVEKELDIFLNKRVFKSSVPPIGGNPSQPAQFLLDSSGVDVYNDKLIEAPDGQWLAPFLRAGYVLKWLFETKCGYTLNLPAGVFDDIIVLHNVADGCIRGTIGYGDFVPDCSFQQFVEATGNLMGGMFWLDDNSKTVNFKRWADAVISTSSMTGETNGVWSGVELSEYLQSEPTMDIRDARQLKITMQRSFDEAETFEEFYPLDFATKYPHIYDHEIDGEQEYPSYSKNTGAVKKSEPKTMVNVEADGTISESEPESFVERKSNCYDWFAEVEGCETEEITIEGEHLPMFSKRISVNLSLTSVLSFYSIFPYYQAGCRYVKTALVMIDKQDIDEDKESKTPLCFCTISRINNAYSLVGNSIEATAVPLRLQTLYPAQWQQYDRILQGGGYVLTARIDPKLQVDENKNYLLMGQPVMVRKVTQTIGRVERQEVEFETIKIYEAP